MSPTDPSLRPASFLAVFSLLFRSDWLRRRGQTLIYRFGRYSLDVDRQELRCGADLVPVEPKVLDLLQYLIRNRERVVSKDDLIANIWGGRIVSESTLTSRIAATRRAIDDTGQDQRLIRTIARKGLRFVAEVKEERAPVGIVEAPAAPLSEQVELKPETSASASRELAAGVPASDSLIRDGLLRRRWLVRGSTFLLVAALVLTGALWVAWPRIAAQRDDLVNPDRRLSLMILPFENVGGDPEQEYFADGITDELMNSMSQLPGKVVARNTAFAYKGKPVDVREVGRDLDVRYVLEGAVQRSGEQVRVMAQLIDAPRAANLWTETFEIDLRDLARLREDVTARLARSLNVELVYAKAARSLVERPRDPDAVDFLMRANAVWARTPRGRDVSEARRLFREALQRDGSLAFAWVGLALTYIRDIRFSPTHQEDLRQAGAAAERAIALDQSSAVSHLVMGWVLYERKRIDQALAAFEHAVQLNANEPWAHASVAAANIVLGRPENALEPLRKAMRLSPRDPLLSNWQMFMGAASLHLQRDGEAIDWLNTSVALNASDPFTHLFLTSALALSGREAEAKFSLLSCCVSSRSSRSASSRPRSPRTCRRFECSENGSTKGCAAPACRISDAFVDNRSRLPAHSRCIFISFSLRMTAKGGARA